MVVIPVLVFVIQLVSVVFFSSSISYVQLEIAVSKRYLQYW